MQKYLVAILMCLFLFLTIGCKRQQVNPHSDVDSLLVHLEEGDLLFRRGTGFVGHVVTMADTEGRYSHVGIVVCKDSVPYIVHAVPHEHDFEGDFDRVKIAPIERFFSGERASAGAIAHSFIDDSTANAMSNQAIQYVKDSIRFDDSFNLDDSNELYCTELIYKLYKKINTDITEGRRTKAGIFGFPDEIIFPSDILKNKKLNIYFVY